MKEIESRYIALFKREPSSLGAIERIEKSLSIILPNDFKSISKFYSGGILGGKAHYAIECGGPADNIGHETLRLRSAVNLPSNMIAIAEPAESLIVMETHPQADISTNIIWLDALDVYSLSSPLVLNRSKVWGSYLDFFTFLLDEEESERNYSREGSKLR